MELLHFNSPTQTIHYFILCLVAILGVIQVSAAPANRRDLLWFDERTSLLIGVLSIPSAFIWFFLVDDELFIPGLAGGEMIAIFSVAFVTAIPISRMVALLARARTAPASQRATRVKEPTL